MLGNTLCRCVIRNTCIQAIIIHVDSRKPKCVSSNRKSQERKVGDLLIRQSGRFHSAQRTDTNTGGHLYIICRALVRRAWRMVAYVKRRRWHSSGLLEQFSTHTSNYTLSCDRREACKETARIQSRGKPVMLHRFLTFTSEWISYRDCIIIII